MWEVSLFSTPYPAFIIYRLFDDDHSDQCEVIHHYIVLICISPGGSVVKNLPAVQETQVRPLCWDDPLEEGMTTHSSILAWRIPWTEQPGRLQPIGCQSQI